jgi:hypothetical protein
MILVAFIVFFATIAAAIWAPTMGAKETATPAPAPAQSPSFPLLEGAAD